MASLSSPLGIGLCGGGVVGGGVVSILRDKASAFADLGLAFEVRKILVRDVSKPRDFDHTATLVTDYNEIVNDPSVNIVVEVIGGVTLAKDIIWAAIKAGKHVVTANKALLAAHGAELTELLNANPSCRFGYEAAVAGGIPIIDTLVRNFGSDKVKQIAGIMNGTTNFMLTKMEREGLDYDVVLKEAQDLGFAEAVPDADVLGYDARAKLSILTLLGFSARVDETKIPCKGITDITSADHSYADKLDATIKLLGVCRRVDSASAGAEGKGGAEAVTLFVSPMMVKKSNIIAQCALATNIIQVESDYMGTSSFIGQGAGRFPTANSVVSDIMHIGQGACPPAFPAQKDIEVHRNFEARFYVRINVKDQIGIIRITGALCEAAGISIHAILQTPIEDHNNVAFAVTTEPCYLEQVETFTAALAKEDFCIGEPFFIPFL
eukprot:g1198.t1